MGRRMIWVLAGLLLGTGSVMASPPTRQYTYTTGSVIDPGQVTANEDSIFSWAQAGVDSFADGSIATADLADSAVTSAKISDGTIAAADIATDAVDTAEIAASAVGASEIASGAVDAGDMATTGTIADDKVFVADSSTAATWRTVTNCTDTGGNHLNYTQSTNSFSCGTSSGTTFGIDVGNFTFDMTSVSGTVAFTGVGFAPQACLFLAGVSETFNHHAWSFTEGVAAEEGYLAFSGTLIWARTDMSFSLRDATASNRQDFDVTTLGADGATLTNTKTGSPTGTATITYVCFD